MKTAIYFQRNQACALRVFLLAGGCVGGTPRKALISARTSCSKRSVVRASDDCRSAAKASRASVRIVSLIQSLSFFIDAPKKFIVIVVATARVVGSFVTHKWLTVKPAIEENEYLKLGLVKSPTILLLCIQKILNFGAFSVFNFASRTQERAIFLSVYHKSCAFANFVKTPYKLLSLHKHSGASNPSVRQYGCVVKDATDFLFVYSPTRPARGNSGGVFFGLCVKIPCGKSAQLQLFNKGAI